MVLEHLFPEEWLEKKSYYAFLLGAGYSVIGIVIARLLFAADPALPAVAFTSLLLLPELYKMFSIEEKQQSRDRKWGFRAFWRDNGDFFRVFLFLFLGILIVYCIASIMLPALSVNSLFKQQIAMRDGGYAAAGAATGLATGTHSLFWNLVTNNFYVMLACFIVALLAGDGAIFFIAWNASVWGTVFGVTARNAAFFSHTAPVKFFGIIFFTVLPHVLLEASCYILAAIAGGLISKGALREGIEGEKFARVFRENLFIIGLAVLCLFAGAFVESFVLTTSDRYAQIIAMSYAALG